MPSLVDDDDFIVHLKPAWIETLAKRELPIDARFDEEMELARQRVSASRILNDPLFGKKEPKKYDITDLDLDLE